MNPEQHCYHKYTPPPFAGEDLKVVASIENSSSREIKPKYTLYQKDSFFARGKRRVSTKDILKELGEPIPPSGKLKVTKVLKIPQHIVPSIFTCSNIKCEYRLKVCVSVSLSVCVCVRESELLKHIFSVYPKPLLQCALTIYLLRYRKTCSGLTTCCSGLCCYNRNALVKHLFYFVIVYQGSHQTFEMINDLFLQLLKSCGLLSLIKM